VTQCCADSPVAEQDASAAGAESAAPLPAERRGRFLADLNGAGAGAMPKQRVLSLPLEDHGSNVGQCGANNTQFQGAINTTPFHGASRKIDRFGVSHKDLAPWTPLGPKRSSSPHAAPHEPCLWLLQLKGCSRRPSFILSPLGLLPILQSSTLGEPAAPLASSAPPAEEAPLEGAPEVVWASLRLPADEFPPGFTPTSTRS